MSKTAFTIFHVPNPERDDLFNAAKETMLSKFNELKTETIFFNDDFELLNFYKKTNISFNKFGYANLGWTRGQLGLWASTYLAIKSFLATDYDNLIVLEDDIVLMNDFINGLLSCINELPEDWDLFFGHISDEWKAEEYNLADVEIGKTNIVRSFQNDNTSCYVISKTGAEKFMALVSNTSFSSPIDYWLLVDSKLSSYTINPMIPEICVNAKVKSQISHATTSPKKFYDVENFMVEDIAAI